MGWAGRRIFHGWLLVGVFFLGGIFNSGLSLWGLGIFVIPMEEDLGWSRATFFGALSLRGLVAGLLSPFVGPWMDTRRGPRILLLVGSVLLGLSIAALSVVEHVWQFYLLYGVIGALAMLGSAQVVGEVVIAKWFVRRRGRAMAISSMATPLSGIFMPALIQVFILLFGWREAWLILGIAGFVLLVPLALLVRTTPEEMGLRPDGETEPPPGPSAGQVRVVGDEISMTRTEAIRSRSFWVLLLAMSLFMLHSQGFQTNWMPFFQDQGFSVATGTAAIAFYGVISILGRVYWGLMADRVHVTILMAIGTTLAGAAILVLLNATSVLILFLYILLQGMTLGGQFLLQPLAVANLFGRAHLGAIRGIMRPALTFSTALGPLVIAALYDMYGSYHVAFIFVMLSWFASGACYYLVWRMRQIAPRPPALEATPG